MQQKPSRCDRVPPVMLVHHSNLLQGLHVSVGVYDMRILLLRMLRQISFCLIEKS